MQGPPTVRAESILQILKPLPQPGKEILMEGTAPPHTPGDKSVPTSRTPHTSFTWQLHSPGLHAGAGKAREGLC